MSMFMICERAIGLIGGNRLDLSADQSIMFVNLDYSGLTGSNAQGEAVACVRHFAPVRDSLLRAYPWVFARRHQVLAELSEARPGWAHSYAAPSDAARVLYLISGGRAVPIFETEGFSSGFVSCNYPDVTAGYTAALDIPLWDPLFADAFVAKLAGEICAAVTGSTGGAAALQQQAMYAIGEAYRLGLIDSGRVPLDEYAWDGYSNDFSGSGGGEAL
jgi:hypothetical protein